MQQHIRTGAGLSLAPEREREAEARAYATRGERRPASQPLREEAYGIGSAFGSS